MTEGLAGDDFENSRAIALRDLTQISNEEIANYIVDRLSPEEITYLTSNFRNVIIEIKKRTKRVDKDVFVNVIIELAQGSETMFRPSQIMDDAKERENLKQKSSRELSKKLNEKDFKYSLRDREYQETAEDKIRKGDLIQQLKAKARAKKQQIIDERARLRQDAPLNRLVDPEITPMKKTPKKPPKRIGMTLGSSSSFGSPPQSNEDELDFYDAYSSPSESVSGRNPQYSGQSDDSEGPPKFDFYKLVDGVSYDQLKNKKYGQTATGKKRRNPTKDQIKHIKSGDLAIEAMEGSGLNKNKRRKNGKGLIYGRGSSLKSQQNRHYLGMYYLEKKKLNENILSVKYSKTDSPILKLRSQKISNELKEIINDVITNKFNKRLYDGLNETDKRLFNRLIDTVKINRFYSN
jgi:hypothetical protein